MSETTKLIMLGAAPETRGSVAAAVEGWRAEGVFRRWPVEYVATTSSPGAAGNAALLWRAVRRFGELLGQHRRAVVHAHFCARSGFWRQCAFAGIAAALGRPLVVQLHGGGYESFHDDLGTPARASVRMLLERAACVIVPCESTHAWVRRIAREARVACVPAAVKVPQAPASLAARPNIVLFLGRLERDKGAFDLLDALAAVRGAVPDVRLVCAGEGDRAAVERYAGQLGVRDAVKFVGWVGPSGKRALLENAVALALPSYAEALPASVLEAMAAGVPVVATAVGGIPEAIADGVSGFLVPPGDTAALARHLRKLLLDRALAARVGAAGRETVRLRYSTERAIPLLEEVYAALGVGASAPEIGVRHRIPAGKPT